MDKPIRYRWALWLGLALTVGGIAASWIFFGDNSNTDATFDRLRPRWLNALLICLLAPLFEEAAFRLWSVGKRWCAIVSSLLAAFYVWQSTHLWWMGLLMMALIALCFFAIRRRQLRDVLLMLLTSAAFAACHAGNFIDVDMDTGMVMVSDCGFGLLACYLVINHGFLWAVLLHVLNNTVAFVALLVVGATWSTTVTTDRYDLTVRYGDEHEISTRGDTVIRCQPLTAFCHDLAWDQQHADSVDNPLQYFYYDIGRSNKAKYFRFTLVDRQPSSRSDYMPLLYAMRDSGLVHIDTLRLPALRLVVADTALMMQTAFYGTYGEGTNMAEVEGACRGRLRMPMLLEHPWDDTLFLCRPFEEFGRIMYTDSPDSAALIDWLGAHGLALLPVPTDTVTSIRFR